MSLTKHQSMSIAANQVYCEGTIELFDADHVDVIKWKHFPRYWPFVRGIHRSIWPDEFYPSLPHPIDVASIYEK